MDLTYSPMVFTKKPHTLKYYLKFGKGSGDNKCPVNSSQIEISGSAGVNILSPITYNNNGHDKFVCIFENSHQRQ